MGQKWLLACFSGRKARAKERKVEEWERRFGVKREEERGKELRRNIVEDGGWRRWRRGVERNWAPAAGRGRAEEGWRWGEVQGRRKGRDCHALEFDSRKKGNLMFKIHWKAKILVNSDFSILFSLWKDFLILKSVIWTSPHGTVDKNPPANAGDMGSIPGLRRFTCHRAINACEPQIPSLTSRARKPQLLKPVHPRACALQQGKFPQWEAHTSQWRVAPVLHN